MKAQHKKKTTYMKHRCSERNENNAIWRKVVSARGVCHSNHIRQ